MERGILGEIYNIGTNFEIPIIHLARQLVQMVGALLCLLVKKCFPSFSGIMFINLFFNGEIFILKVFLILTIDLFDLFADSEECFK